jgi:hypothetical protein
MSQALPTWHLFFCLDDPDIQALNRQPLGEVMFPARKYFDYLAGSPLTSGFDDHDELLQIMLNRRPAVIIGTSCIAMTAAITAHITKATWPLFWLAAEVMLTTAKWIFMSRALTGTALVRRQCRRILAFLILL